VANFIFSSDLVDQIPSGLVVWQLQNPKDVNTFRLTEANPAARLMLDLLPDRFDAGPPTATLPSAADLDPFPAFLKIEPPQAYAKVLQTATPQDFGEVRYRRPNQLEKIYTLKVFPLCPDRVGAILEDVSEQSAVEQALRASEQKLLFYVQQTPLAVIEWNLDFKVVMWNPAAEQIFGYRQAEAIDRCALDLIIPPHSQTEIQQIWHTLIIQKGDVHITNENQCKDGKIVLCEWHSTALVNEDGEVIGVTSLIQDVTVARRKEADRRQFNLQLELSNRELQDFAFVASHDLQEPLRKIQAFGDRLRLKCADVLSDEGQDYLTRIQNAAKRMQTLIDDLLSFSRITTKAQPFVSIDLADIMREVISDLEIRIQEAGGQVEVGDLPILEADPMQMRQLLQNLISNALKFHQPETAPLIRIQSQDLAQNGDRYCQITVADNGIGFDEKYLDRIFTVFQRLHGRSEYEGTGVGLAICRKIVERHGGSITAISQPGSGATFLVTLPLHQK
jgi:two-component system, LuxR family, sensor kinase FixL